MMSDFPKGLLYNTDFSWIKIENNIAEIGVMEPAAKKVNEFVFIQLPDKGKTVKKGEDIIALEAMKWSGHLSSPFSGKVIDVNEELFDEPSKINEDPYKEWIVKIEIEDIDEKKDLMDSIEIEEWASENIN